MAEVDYNLLSTKDLKAVVEGRWDDVSTVALQYIAGEEVGAWEAFSSNAERAVKSSLETITGWFGANASEEDKANIQQQESEARIAAETNPVAGISGQLVGSVLDPVTLPAAILKPLKIAGSALKTGALRGAAGGAFGGALQPVFEEFGDTRTTNIVAGVALGGAIGGAAGSLLKKFGIDISADPNEIKAKIDALPPDQKEQLMLEWNGKYEELPPSEKLVEPEPAFVTPTKPVEWNPELKSLETVEEAPSLVDLTMPAQVKKPITINKVQASFENDLDHAFWQVKTGKGVQKQAATSWLMDRTGLSQKEVELHATTAQKELARRLGGMKPNEAGKLSFDTPTMVSSLLTNRLAPSRQVRTPYQPKRIDVKDGLDPDDIQNLKLTGVIVTQNKNGEIRFRDALAPRQPFLGAAELKHRMNAVGIDLDVPGYRGKVKRASAVPEKEVTQAAPTPEAAKAVSEAIPEDIGIPKAYGSVGSAGVDPKTYGAEDLLPKTFNDIMKGGETRDRVLMKMLDNDDPRLAIPKDIDPKVIGKGSLLAAKQQGKKALKEIIKEHGNFLNFMISRRGEARNMSADEVSGFRWFHADAMANKAKTIDDLVEMRKRGDSFDSPRAAELARDLVYYEGVDMFWRNDGSKASRALNARKIVLQYTGKKLKTIFPGAGC